jgi:hypothetical protein
MLVGGAHALRDAEDEDMLLSVLCDSLTATGAGSACIDITFSAHREPSGKDDLRSTPLCNHLRTGRSY